MAASRAALPLLKFKMVPPAPGVAVLRRLRLVDRLRESLDHPELRGTALIAGAGYGKTTLAAGLLQEPSLEPVWYSLDPSDRDPTLFFRYVIEAIRQRCEDFGRLAEGLLAEGSSLSQPDGVDRFVDVLINDARETLASRICLILDDVHHLDGSEAVMGGLRRMLNFLPDSLHIMMTSRTVPDIGVPALRSKGRLAVIDQRDLAFSAEETRDLLVRVCGLGMDDGRIAGLHAQAQGWVTALQLFRQQALANREDEADLPARTREEVFDYFSDDVYAHEAGQVQAFLRRSSLPAMLDTEILTGVLDDLPVRGIVESLQRRNLFIVPRQGQEGAHTYHPLFRDFLARKLIQAEGEDAARDLHVRYARAYERRQDHAAALHHFIEARAAAPLAALLTREGPGLVQHGMLETVKRACANLDDAAPPSPRLMLLQAEILRIEGNYPGASRGFEAGLTGGTDLTSAEKASALQGKAYAEMKLGALQRSEALAQEALALVGQDDVGLRARILNTLSIAAYRQGRYDGAIHGWKDALDLARRAGDRPLMRRVAHNLGLPHGMRGDYDKALDYFRMLLHLEEEADPAPGHEYATAALNVARIEILRGRMREAARHLDDALEISRKFDLEALRADVLEAQGNLLRETGDVEGARDRYALARALFTDLGLDDLRDDVDEEEARLMLAVGEQQEGQRRADDLLQRSHEATPPPRRASALQLAGEARLEGAPSDAIGLLQQARDLSRKEGLRYQEAEAGLLLAQARLMAGDQKTARRDALEALAHVTRFGYGHMARRLSARHRRLGSLLASLAEWGPHAGETAGGGAVEDFDLTVRMLGPVEVYRDEQRRIPASAWTLRKALRILCYLAAARDRRATKDRIADTFWPDGDPAVIEKNFHPTISYLRKALNMSHPVKKNFVLFEKGAYRLNPQYRYRIDLVEFEDALRGARAARGSDPREALRWYGRALDLYRGDFLEEEYDDWVQEVREHYAGQLRDGLEEASVLYGVMGRWDQALACAQRLVQRDPFSEAASCRVIHACAMLGNRAGVAQEYQRLVQVLRDELKTEPLEETRSIYEHAMKGAEKPIL
ncbi:MAG: BTAD domain-containing putative transcriptional regulator [Candidatus Polarisedimenticolia bacterium]